MRTDSISIVCAGDRTFIMPIKVMLKSLLVNTRSEVQVFILSTGWGEAEKKRFDELVLSHKNVRIHFLDIPKEKCPKAFKVTRNITIETYYRLFIPQELPQSIEEVIYLDGDIIVEGDIRKLWEIPMKNCAVMAVPEMFHDAHRVSSPLALNTYADLGIPGERKYFNAGVLKINLKKWREEKIPQKILAYLEEYRDKVLWHDQDGLNAVLWKDWSELPYEWNVMTALFHEKDYRKIDMDEKTAKDLMASPKIIHYTNSREKPWKDSCTHPLKSRFQYYKELLTEKEKV